MGSCQKDKSCGFCCFGEEDNSHNEKVFTSQPRPSGPPSGRQMLLNTKESMFLKINGKDLEIDVSSITATTSLASYLRNNLHLTGTKTFCYQGGCGACIITASVPTKDGRKIMSANSCLTPLLSCDGWEITTVEGLGNRTDGLHPVQATLAEFSGTQCGFCSPGMVMQMNSLLEANPKATVSDVEKILDGNICRCTGYRPIFDAFKSLASDAPAAMKQKAADIEDLCCKKDNGCCKKKPSSTGGSLSSKALTKHFIPTGKGDWYAPSNIEDLITVLDNIPLSSTYTFVGGNSGRGIYNPGSFDVYIDVRKCIELSEYSFSPMLTIGAAVTLTGVIKIFDDISAAMPNEYGHCKAMANHIRKVANTGVRNIGTLAGNMMLKHAHPDFASDLYTLLAAARAAVVIRSSSGIIEVPVEAFLAENLNKSVITQFTFPALSSEYKYVSYKITPRSENAHAYVNAAFSARVSPDNFVATDVRIVYGGISAEFHAAVELENAITGKSLNDSGLLTTALNILDATVNPTPDYVLASVDYRKYLTKALYYKFLISALGSAADPRIQSGATQIARGMSSGKQAFQTDPEMYPVNMAMPKIEARSQCSGEAEYVNDIPSLPNELTGAFVLATVGNCDLDVVDPSAALAIPGVLAFYDYKSLPGKNQANLFPLPEYVFSEGHVEYAGQAIGFVVAENAGLARQAASAVKITYKNLKKPVLTIRDALKDPARVTNKISFPPMPKNLGKDVTIIEGEFEIGSQFHFHLETQVCIVKPVEDHQFEIYSANQWMDNVQISVAKALNIPEGSIEVRVRRMGGAYGAKISPPAQLAVACALAAKNLRRPVRTVLDLKTNMELVGKRWPYLVKYNAGVSLEGKLKFVNLLLYADGGYVNNESETYDAARFAKNCYASEFWSIQKADVLTNTAANKSCRAPGTTQGVAAIEYVMEHIATTLGEDPLEFRLKNMIASSQGVPNPLPDQIIPQVLQTSNYAARKQEVEQFNANNAWKKRGISVVPILYPFKIEIPGASYYFSISIYAQDGTIAISHGGHEMGQGINTKVVQTVGRILGVPLDIIHQKPANSFSSPNSIVSGGSFTTDFVCGAAITACEALRERIRQVEVTMSNPTWPELILECYQRGVDLSARHMGFAERDAPIYDIWGCAVTEIEVDILTGEKNVRRVDMIEDTGSSVNPTIDIGQMEGAFVMSLGLWLTEQLKFDPDTGRLLTIDTWEYKPPASHDIPEDFRLTLFDNGKSPAGVFGAKAIGEPALLFGISALFAVKQALNAGRMDLGFDPRQWFHLYGPATNERVQLTSGIKSHHFFL